MANREYKPYPNSERPRSARPKSRSRATLEWTINSRDSVIADVRRLESQTSFSMLNPYDSPISKLAADRPTMNVPLWALLVLGIFPGAIIVTIVVESILYPTRGWNVEDWFWSVCPASYLAAMWLFALYSFRHNSRTSLAWLAILMIPLLLFFVRTWAYAANLCFFLMAGLDGFGFNAVFRLTAVLMPLWLGASVAFTLYFCYVILKLMRLTKSNSHADRGEPRVEPEFATTQLQMASPSGDPG